MIEFSLSDPPLLSHITIHGRLAVISSRQGMQTFDLLSYIMMKSMSSAIPTASVGKLAGSKPNAEYSYTTTIYLTFNKFSRSSLCILCSHETNSTSCVVTPYAFESDISGYRSPLGGNFFKISSNAAISSSSRFAGAEFSLTRSEVVAPGMGMMVPNPFLPLRASTHPVAT